MKIKEINKDSRPRERLISNGANSLSDIELLAIMLGSGNKNESVIELSARLINEYSFERLFKMSFDELKSINGIKEAKATKLMACFEIAKRCMSKNIIGVQMLEAEDVYNYILPDYQLIDYEMVTIIYTDIKCRVIAKTSFSNELVDKIIFPIRKIINECINNKAFGIFIIHNHPSGDIKPSKSDITSTINLYNILKGIEVILFDHLIITKDKYFSFDKNRLLNFD
ncbi:MAG: DNA repair protein RadC [Acholeplasmatales bacterium]|nr:DNA repair protein RadC [Acholeplasmatales bacterium]